jgi:hypothetical protein
LDEEVDMIIRGGLGQLSELRRRKRRSRRVRVGWVGRERGCRNFGLPKRELEPASISTNATILIILVPYLFDSISLPICYNFPLNSRLILVVSTNSGML